MMTMNGTLPSIIKTVDFKIEPFSLDLVDEMIPLWKAHYDEIAFYKDFPLSPHIDMYEKSHQVGMSRIYTARYEGKLIGYQVFFVYPHPHFSTMIGAFQDSLFLSMEMRKGSNGYRFIKWCDEELEHEGVDVIFHGVSETKDFGVLLKRLGYIERDKIYSRRLK